ncbi:NADH-dependent dehydrogenase [Planctomycetales bacterium]|nr:NADH-dependent dehydrogenase [Planctomycetales bacterium]GHT36608.1 NADH-dependent dehydrogenase [Planctomycetales bacterium]
MSSITRRRFIEETLSASFAASAAATIASGGLSSAVFAQEQPKVDKNSEVGIALIGAGGRIGDHIGGYTKDKRVKILYICDPDVNRAEARSENFEKKYGYRLKVLPDFRKALEDKNVDVVSGATCNHWHVLASVWALQAGKHVYMEKPLTHNIHEGKAIVAAQKKYGKVVQTGTQCRSAKNVQDIVKFVQEGGIGEIKLAHGLCYKRRKSIGAKGDYPIPPGVDFDFWSGPAPITSPKLTRKRFDYDWHWQRLYGNGDLGNQGPHQTDIARWLLGLDRFPQSVIAYGGRLGYDVETKDPNYVDAGDTPNTVISIYDYGDKTLVFETLGLETPNLNIPVGENFGTQVGVIAYGSKGYAIQGGVKGQSYSLSYAYDLDGNEIKAFTGGDNHYANFVDAVLANDPSKVNADARTGALSAAVSHLGNISYYLGESNKVSADDLRKTVAGIKSFDDNSATLERILKHLTDGNGVDLKKTPLSLGPQLKIDVEKEEFIGNDAANALATREYRAPYIVPAPDKV